MAARQAGIFGKIYLSFQLLNNYSEISGRILTLPQ